MTKPWLDHLPKVTMEVPSGFQPLGMAVVLGRVVGGEGGEAAARDVILPTATEVILDAWQGWSAPLEEAVPNCTATWCHRGFLGRSMEVDLRNCR